MMKRIEDFYNKRDFDYSRGNINPCDFHNVNMYYLLKTFGISDIETPAPWAGALTNFIIFMSAQGLTMSLFTTYHAIDIKEVTLVAEAVMYFFIFSHNALCVNVAKSNLKEFQNLLRAMRSDFDYVCTIGAKYREKFFELQVETWKDSMMLFMFITVCNFGVVFVSIIALMYYSVTHEPDDGTSRPLLFPVWSPVFDVGETPYYEFSFVFFNIVPTCASFGFIFNMTVQLIWVREISTKADLMKWHIEDLLDGIYLTDDKEDNPRDLPVLMNRMKHIVKQHIDMYSLIDDFCTVYKKLMTYLIEVYAIDMCLTAYSIAEKFSDGEIRFVATTLCVATFVVTLIQSYLCSTLATKVLEVGEWCGYIEYWRAGPELRPYIIMIIMKSHQPLPFRSGGFHEMGLPIFSQKTTTAYSMYNMLRQFQD